MRMSGPIGVVGVGHRSGRTRYRKKHNAESVRLHDLRHFLATKCYREIDPMLGMAWVGAEFDDGVARGVLVATT